MNSINGDLLNFVDDLNKRIYQNMVSTLCALQGNFQHLEDLLQLQKTVQNIKESAFYKMNKEVPLKAEKKLLQPKTSAMSFAASEECLKLENLDKSVIRNDDPNVSFLNKGFVSNLTPNQTRSNIFENERKEFSYINRKPGISTEMQKGQDIYQSQSLITNGNNLINGSMEKNMIIIKEKSFIDDSDSCYSHKNSCSMENNSNHTQRRDYYNSSAFTNNNNRIKKASKNRISDLKPQINMKNPINQKNNLKPKKISHVTNLDINRIRESALKTRCNSAKVKNSRPASNGKDKITYKKPILNKEQPKKRNNFKRSSSRVENSINKTMYKLISKSM